MKVDKNILIGTKSIYNSGFQCTIISIQFLQRVVSREACQQVFIAIKMINAGIAYVQQKDFISIKQSARKGRCHSFLCVIGIAFVQNTIMNAFGRCIEITSNYIFWKIQGQLINSFGHILHHKLTCNGTAFVTTQTIGNGNNKRMLVGAKIKFITLGSIS